ncbi:hypothetical protein N7455_003932 [Penicillium solitum]|uniref:uncharacterized protein n=1 Tax=Penicillium solitum TaxID=60172 RepID=UPI0032C472AA|nr:hypothetical protein N7455_003922 [Penicillium solitum]KAJ5868986.1 hypothetical protein N7455_003927 [Penicillium solitum]KAJ5868991.1 hypothetical protein N7455_003932 [Penicillium solitum]
MASGHRSTDPNGAGGQKAPGLQSPRRGHQGRSVAWTPRSNQAGRHHKGDTARGGGYGGGSSVAGSRVTPLRWVIPPSVEVRRKAATIRTGEGISLAGKMQR